MIVSIKHEMKAVSLSAKAHGFQNRQGRKGQKRTIVSAVIFGYHALCLICSIGKAGIPTALAHTCQEDYVSGTVVARISTVVLIRLHTSLWRLIWFDEHLAETAVQ